MTYKLSLIPVLTFCCRYICFGAVLFSEWEGWNFLDSSYFCFISLSTIGFGDIVPGERVIKSQEIELSFIFCSMYLMFGMALIAMCFNLMQEEVVHKMRSCMRSLKFMFSCKRRERRDDEDDVSGIRWQCLLVGKRCVLHTRVKQTNREKCDEISYRFGTLRNEDHVRRVLNKGDYVGMSA